MDYRTDFYHFVIISLFITNNQREQNNIFRIFCDGFFHFSINFSSVTVIGVESKISKSSSNAVLFLGKA